MQTNLLQQIKEKVALLSTAEQISLADFLTEKTQKAGSNGVSKNEPFDLLRQNEQKWLEKNREKFAGEWVALAGDKLLSHGTDGRKVYAEAKKKGVKVPFVVHLETNLEKPFGGW